MKKFWTTILASVLVSSLTALVIVTSYDKNRDEVYSYQDYKPIFNRTSFNGDDLPSFTYAAESSVKAVVYVKVTKRSERNTPNNFLEYFFGIPGQPRDMIGAGSGVIITEDGYIVTNNHVTEGATEIEVTLENGKVFKAKLVGSDPTTDVALLKIDASDLPYIPLGDSDKLQLGEWVLAIGAPYDLRSTITAGIVSAKGRSSQSYDGEFRIESFIQTDAAVNAGNSGGALVNTKGELVGINTAIISMTGSFAGYSFAIPVNIVKKVAEDLIDFGSVKRAMLGIEMKEIDDAFAKEMKLSGIFGVYIERIVKGGAAEKAGIKPGDVLVSIDSINVNSISAAQAQISRYRPGDKIEVKVIRNEKERIFRAELTGEEDLLATLTTEGSTVIFGAEIQNVSEEMLKERGLPHGVEVVSVGRGKFFDAGIKSGFIITYINDVKVERVEDIEKVIKQAKRSIIIEGVSSSGITSFYAIGL